MEADLPAIREVFRSASLSNAGEREVLLAHPEVLVFDGGGIAEGRVRVAVADDGAVLGFASVLVTGEVAELEDLFVDPGRMRQGIATRLVEDAMARVGGAVEVTANEHAMAFYTSAGFVQVGVAQTRFGPARRLRRAAGRARRATWGGTDRRRSPGRRDERVGCALGRTRTCDLEIPSRCLGTVPRGAGQCR